MSERFAAAPDAAWIEVDSAEYSLLWNRFEERFAFRASADPASWPAIREPTPSVTFDLGIIPDGPQRGAAYDAINAEALRAFVWAIPDRRELVVLDWQHRAYRFNPANQALTWKPDWQVPVFPDGDYLAFLSEDFTEGTFGHPWEETICVLGDRLINSLGRSLATWLPIKRENGRPA